MKKRNIVLTLLVLIGVITFLDKVNISVAGAAIKKDLNLFGIGKDDVYPCMTDSMIREDDQFSEENKKSYYFKT